MKIFSQFIEAGSPVTGLTPELTIINVSRDKEESPVTMTELSTGVYFYEVKNPIIFRPEEDYLFLADGGAGAGTVRYQMGDWNGYESLLALIPRGKGGGFTLSDEEKKELLNKLREIVAEISSDTMDRGVFEMTSVLQRELMIQTNVIDKSNDYLLSIEKAVLAVASIKSVISDSIKTLGESLSKKISESDKSRKVESVIKTETEKLTKGIEENLNVFGKFLEEKVSGMLEDNLDDLGKFLKEKE